MSQVSQVKIKKVENGFILFDSPYHYVFEDFERVMNALAGIWGITKENERVVILTYPKKEELDENTN